MLYLVTYPFESNEQVASRVLAVAALRDVLSAFSAEGLPSNTELLATLRRDIALLHRHQRADGGFGFWGSDSKDWPYLGVHVAHAIARAEREGFAVPRKMRERSLAYLEQIAKHIPSSYGPRARDTIEAYALFVRDLMGKADPKRAKALLHKTPLDDLPLEALGWILPTLSKAKATAHVAKIQRRLDNRVTETAATAHLADGYGDEGHVVLHSNRRADGIVLEALVGSNPKHDLIPKLVRGLLAHRSAGRWSNTQECAFVLLALERYFERFEKQTPDFVAHAWLGERYAGQHQFKGRTTDRHRIDIPMSALGEAGHSQTLVLHKKGKGRMYYRVGMKYAPTDLLLPPADHGFAVERSYEAIDDPKDVRRDSDGTWQIAAGAEVRVRLTMVADSRRAHVALVDALPAGLEPLNPALATTGPVPTDPKSTPSKFWWWSRPWYEHQNMRDERVEAFASLLWEGVHVYSYVARATTPGTFVVPPAKAEEMYHPETFGRSAGARVRVE